MARYKDYNYDQLKLLPISFSHQILPCGPQKSRPMGTTE